MALAPDANVVVFQLMPLSELHALNVELESLSDIATNTPLP